LDACFCDYFKYYYNKRKGLIYKQLSSRVGEDPNARTGGYPAFSANHIWIPAAACPCEGRGVNDRLEIKKTPRHPDNDVLYLFINPASGLRNSVNMLEKAINVNLKYLI